ncbi:hypothetical protein AVEN_162517-1 [Araneus ventricosus]|uniref:Uncharacterized protein n=1 Tax=Araneus ventricosus TaxID=182803 RepID=A0A4Y2X844_ARAVE|nr:hypothetical protein AVEN_103728-1 [Araneus ventricosus]GBO45761.1 hypothetical protein AVEN_162517-1 [Araneus ventricosus]
MNISTPTISIPFELESPSTNSTEIFTILTTHPTLVKIKSKLLQLLCSQDNMRRSVIHIYCEDSRPAVQLGLAKVDTWTVGKLNKGVFTQRAFFTSCPIDERLWI